MSIDPIGSLTKEFWRQTKMSTLLDEQGRSDARAEKVVWAIHSDTTQWAPRQNYQPNTLKVTTWLHHRFLDFQTGFTKYIAHLEHETKRSAQNYLSKFYRNFGQNVAPAKKKNNLRHLKDCATKKKVWHLKMSTGSLTKRPFCTQHFETTRFCISKNFVPCSTDKARTRERSSAREVSGNPFCARFLSQTENQGSTNFFLSSKKNNKNVVTNSRSTKPCIRTPSVTKLFWDVLGNIQVDPGCTLLYIAKTCSQHLTAIPKFETTLKNPWHHGAFPCLMLATGCQNLGLQNCGT